MSDDDRASLTSIQSLHASPDSITSKSPELLDQLQSRRTRFRCIELVTRVRAMTMELLPVEVNHASITEPTSRVITPQVISTYMAAAGDFHEAVCGPASGTITIFDCLCSFRMLFCAPGATSCMRQIITRRTMAKITAERLLVKCSRVVWFICLLQTD